MLVGPARNWKEGARNQSPTRMAFDMKNEEDVKEYLKNLGIEYKFGCYSEKNPEVCHLLGDFLESIKKDFTQAATVYKSNCDDYQYARSCGKYGAYALVGRGRSKQNPAEAFQYMKKGCELGDKDSCTYAGVMATSSRNRENDQEVPMDIPLGISMLDKACHTYKSGQACFFLAGIYLSGIEGHLEKNMREAYKHSLKACEFGNAYACANVSQMHARGHGVQKDANLAETFKQRALQLQKELEDNQPPLQFQQGINS